MLILALGELVCYILFFHHVHTGDKKVKHLLMGNEFHIRRKTNAISFVGQFYVFCTKFLFMVAVTFALMKGKSHVMLIALSYITKFVEFGLLSIVEVMTSHKMRNDLLNRWRRIIGLFSYLIFWL